MNIRLTLSSVGQASSHGRLRAELLDLISERAHSKGSFSWFDDQQSIAFFRFLQHNDVDGIAARVWSYRETATGTVPLGAHNITQAKRQTEDAGNSTTQLQGRGLWQLSFDELRDLVNAGLGTEHIIHANDSAVSWLDPTGSSVHISEMDTIHKRFRWHLEDGDEDEDDGRKAAFKIGDAKSKKFVGNRMPVLMRSISDHTVTPLLKRATAEDLQEAQVIVQRAIEESAEA